MKKKTFLHEYRKHRLAVVAALVLLIEIILLIIIPVFIHLDPYSMTPIGFNHPPAAGYIFGTDDAGRDLFARVIYGGRTSLLVGCFSTAVSTLIGLPLGVISGYYRGVADAIIMRAADIFMSIPSMVLILVIVAIFKPSMIVLILLIGVLGWPSIARLMRSNVMSVREKQYVEAAKSSGVHNLPIIMRYVLPNAISPLWSSIAFSTSSAILMESGLSFLGAGIQPPQASWGNIISAAKSVVVISGRPWVWLPPGLLLVITVISINLIGEGIRDALDPKMVR